MRFTVIDEKKAARFLGTNARILKDRGEKLTLRGSGELVNAMGDTMVFFGRFSSVKEFEEMTGLKRSK